jgi:DNA-binding response OmpR family regulator
VRFIRGKGVRHAASGVMKTEARGQVLVIEDESKLATILTRALAAIGFEATSSVSGLRGLKLAESGGYSLVILDLVLPDLDGFSILEQLIRGRPRQEVLVLSALSDVSAKVRCLELGAADYLSKPFDLAELMARVRRRVQSDHQNGGDRVLESSTLTLDLQRRRITRGDESVSLSTREFALLEYLMQRQGEVCSREELLEHVWGYSFDPGTNIVEVCIGRLRHKISAPCIETVRNAGYCFVDS